jgi:hypothetical protein
MKQFSGRTTHVAEQVKQNTARLKRLAGRLTIEN